MLVRDGDFLLTLSSDLRTTRNLAVSETGRRVDSAAGGSGLLGLDVICDLEGNDWVLDLNLRRWGPLGSSFGAGVDFAEGHMLAIGVKFSIELVRRARRFGLRYILVEILLLTRRER
jgi:hypothetical protein